MAARGIATPTIEDMVLRAEGLVPVLAERAAETERLRRITDRTLEDLRRQGFFRVLQPVRYGGFELDYGRTQVELSRVLGRGCGSTAWVQSIIACHAWCLGMFPPEAQDAVWGDSADALLASSFAPLNGGARRVDGGYVVGGQWQFSSGSEACDWIIVGAPTDDSGTAMRLWCLIPRKDWEPVDTWFAAGLRGSGSGDVRVRETFVPDAFTLNPGELDGRPSPGSAVNSSPNYRLPLAGVFSFNVSSPALGIAKGAIEQFSAQAAARPERANQPQRQLRLAESAAEVDAAEALLLADAAEVQRRARANEAFSDLFIAKLQRDLSFSAMRCAQAVDRLTLALGAHGMGDDNPVQRAARDVHAVANHGSLGWDNAGLAFGRVAFGLPAAPARRG